MVKLFLKIHEDTKLSDETGIFFTPLNNLGKQKAIENIALYKKHHINKIFSSPYLHTLQSCLPYAKHINENINIECALYDVLDDERYVFLKHHNYLRDISKKYSCIKAVDPYYKSTVITSNVSFNETPQEIINRLCGFLYPFITNTDPKHNENILLMTHPSTAKHIVLYCNRFKYKIVEL